MIKELFVEKKDYRDTSFYAYAVQKMKEGIPLVRGKIILDSMENIDLYFEKHRKLFKDITNYGFDMDLASKTGVVIGRSGNLIHFREGHHTLAMARILRIDKINIRKPKFYSFYTPTKEKYYADNTPVSTACDCLLCTRYTKSYLAHLFKIEEVTAMRLATIPHQSIFMTSSAMASTRLCSYSESLFRLARSVRAHSSAASVSA